jgi:serine protease Do
MKKRYVISAFSILVIMINVVILSHRYNQKKDLTNSLTNTKINLVSQEDKNKSNAQINIQRKNAITNAVSIVEASVVSVNVVKTEIVRQNTDPLQNPFFGFFGRFPYERQVKSLGSGVIFSKEGYILTNSHVVEGASEIKIVLPDGRSMDGKLIGIDTAHDIAVVRAIGKNLPVAKLGTSSDLIIGEWSIAIGNPYGFFIKDSKPSVSVGVISAVKRNFSQNRNDKIYKDMIQTDAAINPGNSGGPLVNIFGEVIGINTFILSQSGGSIGIGFAIPIDRVKKIAAELIKYGGPRKIWFGFKVDNLNPMIANYFHLKNMDGVIVTSVDPKSPVYRQGLRRGDIILEINSHKIKNADDAEMAVSDISVGDTVILKIRGKIKSKKIIFKALELK